MLKVTEKGRYRIVKTKEVVHYMNKLEKDLTEGLDEIRGEMTYGALSTMWYKSYIDIEDILKEISWTCAQYSILNIAGIIKESTYAGLKEQVEKLYDDIWNMPI